MISVSSLFGNRGDTYPRSPKNVLIPAEDAAKSGFAVKTKDDGNKRQNCHEPHPAIDGRTVVGDRRHDGDMTGRASPAW